MTHENTGFDHDAELAAFIRRHRLPADWADLALKWFKPLADRLFTHQFGASQPLIIGIIGSQGSGKSTLADYLVHCLHTQYGLKAVALSLDDFYLTRAQRRQLAANVHPLLQTRGVPGTHDITLACATLDDLSGTRGKAAMPRFDKATDDRAGHVEQVQLPLDVIVLEGWCLGIQPQSAAELAQPVNALEQQEDPDGSWRRHVNTALAQHYPALFDRVGQWIMLQAPSFDCVYHWRLEQERKLQATVAANAAHRGMNEAQLQRFIQHYQRLTEHALRTMPARVQHLFQLDEQRQITSYRQQAGVTA